MMENVNLTKMAKLLKQNERYNQMSSLTRNKALSSKHQPSGAVQLQHFQAQSPQTVQVLKTSNRWYETEPYLGCLVFR